MTLRCREGDLALIIREEPGCDVNIGRVVNVAGPIKFDPLRGLSWLIEPAASEPWSYVAPSGGRIVTRPIRFSDRIEHPDAWLLPLRPEGEGPAQVSKREVPQETVVKAPDRAVAEEPSG